MDYIIYNGIDSRALNIEVVRVGSSPLLFNMTPPSRIISEKINGKQGEMFIEQTYEPRQIDVVLYIKDVSPSALKMVGRWLGGLGVFDLMLSTEPYKIYKASVEQGLNPDIYNIKQGILPITFTCLNPFGYSSFTAQELQSGIAYNTGLLYNSGIPYYDSGLVKYSFTSSDLPNINIYHGGNADYALPVITINGSATSLTIGLYSDSARSNLITEYKYGAFSGELVIDSELQETALNSTLNNATQEGDYFTLRGTSDLDFITQGEIQSLSTSSIVLDSNASSINDFYNGYTLILYDNKGNVNYKNIIDYVGVSKTAIFSTITDGIVYTNYMIYDVKNTLNYFKITGTGLSISTVDFDFRFVYL